MQAPPKALPAVPRCPSIPTIAQAMNSQRSLIAADENHLRACERVGVGVKNPYAGPPYATKGVLDAAASMLKTFKTRSLSRRHLLVRLDGFR